MTDPIADLLTRIRNAQMAGHTSCLVPLSKIKENIVQVLKKHNYVISYTTQETDGKKSLLIELPSQETKINYKRISSPGQRIYKKSSDVKSVCNGLGIAIYSTSKGVMDNVEAKKNNLGGELLCEVH